MSLTTNRMLIQKKEDGCFAISSERKYYNLSQTKTFIKRSLRPREWQINMRGMITVPRLGSERLRNEAATLLYLREHTTIPVPKVLAAFDDDEAFYLIIEYIDGIGMDELQDEQKQVVSEELEEHLRTLHKIRSRSLGGLTGIIVPPYRAMIKTFRDDWKIEKSLSEEYVFCHNDLSQNNVIVDSKTLKIKAILDWEYAGFYPESFEARFFTRLGPSVALLGEVDDSDIIAEFFVNKHQN